jgi:hypothetical protein
MPDPEALVLKIGSVILVMLVLIRFILYEYNNLRDDLKRKRKRR